ncbi:hypothetical protein [Epibacterium ulvae]|uniref:hypothetical protein n=1 Tax=Epibacterium ulvae TaxID=1156985 RepID=UPI00248F8E27|nr:hypothetical protein [Epibacterium ulvae]
MQYTLCPSCMKNGFCRRKAASLVSDDQLNNSEYLRDLKAFARRVNLPDCQWHEFLVDLYRDFPGWVSDGEDEVFLDMEEFERPYIREWFRDFLRPLPDDVQPRVRAEAKERVRIMATLLTAHYPATTMLWGVRAANQNAEVAH